ncbi:unnamed protein product [Auanema sp. JU1783]|nr:unnamed protein product [Auanema sp. JU1783]
MGLEPRKRLDDYVQIGRYVIFICIFTELIIIIQVTSQFYMVYAGASPTVKSCNGESFPADLEDKEICLLYQNMSCQQTELAYQFRSVNVEWKYFCQTSKTVKNSISVQMFGVLCGSVVFGQLSDTFGRKISMLVSMTGMAIGWIMVAHSQSLLQFTVLRTIVGFFTGGSVSVSNVYVMENIPKKHRMWINMAITWSPNIPLVALIAYLSKSWDMMANVTALLAVPPILFCLFLIHESPRWLVTKGRVDEAREIIKKQLKTSNQEHLLDEEFEAVLLNEYQLAVQANAKRRQYSYYHLFCTWKLALTTIVLAYSYFSTSIINYGIMFNMEKLSGSLYWNSVYTGLMRYACNLSFGYADLKFKKVGRKFIHTSGHVVVLGSLGLVVFAYLFDLNHPLKEQISIAILIASSMTSQIYIADGIVGTELFPTPVRNLGYSFLQLWNRAGVIISPFVFYLQDYWLALPYCVMLMFSLVDMFAFECLLPETKGLPLIEHMPPKEQRIFGRKSTLANQREALVVEQA